MHRLSFFAIRLVHVVMLVGGVLLGAVQAAPAPAGRSATVFVPVVQQPDPFAQVQAIWSLVRRHGYEEPVFRQRVRERYGRQLEFLTKLQASEVIAAMSEGPPPARPSNGHAGQELVR